MAGTVARIGPGKCGALAPVGMRFALATPRPAVPGAVSETAEGRAARPFGLRFFRPAGDLRNMELPAYRYCPVRQVAVTDDGIGEPLIRRLVSWDKTTTGETDSQGQPQEEWTMDFMR